MKDTAIVILAAGESRRFGSPKQLAVLDGRSLIRRAAETALASNAGIVCIVLGANSELIRAEIEDLPLMIVVNDGWRDGIGSSIKTGTAALLNHVPDLSAIAIVLADQPFVDTSHLNRLLASESLAASVYRGTTGVPVLIPRPYIPELLELPPASGAKAIIERNSDSATLIDFDPAAVDIDTTDDLDALL